MTPTEVIALAEQLHAEPHPATPADGVVSLGAVDAAYVTMIEDEYRAAVLNAQQLRAARLSIVFKAHGITDGSTVTLRPAEHGQPMQLHVVPPVPPARLNGDSA